VEKRHTAERIRSEKLGEREETTPTQENGGWPAERASPFDTKGGFEKDVGKADSANRAKRACPQRHE